MISLKPYTSIYQERAMSLSEAKSLALAQYKDTDGITVVIYDPRLFYSATDLDDTSFSSDYIWNDAIYATSTFGSDDDVPKGAWVIRRTASKPGTKIGPLLYDIILSIAAEHNKFIVPDRYSVSDLAQSVWRYYHDLRPDVLKVKLDDDMNPITKPKSDDGKLYPKTDDSYDNRHFLNFMYKIKHPLDTTRMIQNHIKLLDIANDLKVSKSKFFKTLETVTHQFFVYLFNNKKARAGK